jgi:RNA polymerase sigma factor (sigma-70 family)
MAQDPVQHSIETVFRIERLRLVGGLARMTRDLALAEDLAQEALLVALAEWPRAGVPPNPGAWLMTVARRRALDHFRRASMTRRKHAELAPLMDEADDRDLAELEARLDDDLGDEVLGLIFTACHPLLAPEARVALTLRVVAGLSTEEIARAYLTPPATVAQRITRAKQRLGAARLAFEVPQGDGRLARLGSVLEVIYLIFNEGYAATSGSDLTRPALCAEAQRLGRILAGLLPQLPEVLALLALMDLQASRLPARQGADGKALTLPQQNRALWDHLMIRRGLAGLARVAALGGSDGPYALQAALAACHARARRYEDTDWPRIAGIYDRLALVMPSPVVALNRAVAHGVAFGPEAGLALLAQVRAGGALETYAPLAAAEGDMLLRAGRNPEGRQPSPAPPYCRRTRQNGNFWLPAQGLAAIELAHRSGPGEIPSKEFVKNLRRFLSGIFENSGSRTPLRFVPELPQRIEWDQRCRHGQTAPPIWWPWRRGANRLIW